MNTIAILPGGREICPLSFKKHRGRRGFGKAKESYNSSSVSLMNNSNNTKSDNNSNLMNASFAYSCLYNTTSELDYSYKQNFLASAVIALNLFEDLLEVKRYLGVSKGTSI